MEFLFKTWEIITIYSFLYLQIVLDCNWGSRHLILKVHVPFNRPFISFGLLITLLIHNKLKWRSLFSYKLSDSWLFFFCHWKFIQLNCLFTWISFCLVWWHIKYCWLFNAKSFFHTYIKYMICKHILSIQLNDQTVLFLTIQFSINHLFALNVNVKQFYLTHWLEPVSCYHSRPAWTWKWWQWRGTQHSPKLLHYWSLAITLFTVISRSLRTGGYYPSAEIQLVYSTAPADWALHG